MEDGEGDDTLVGTFDTSAPYDDSNTFVYRDGDGNDTISYFRNQDVLIVSEGNISSVSDTPQGVVFTIGEGSVTLQAHYGKIHIRDGQGHGYEYSGSGITPSISMNEDFTGNIIDLNNFFSIVERLNVSTFQNDITLLGNDNNNFLVSGSGDDTLHGDVGDKTLYDGEGNDMFYVNEDNIIIITQEILFLALILLWIINQGRTVYRSAVLGMQV